MGLGMMDTPEQREETVGVLVGGILWSVLLTVSLWIALQI